MSWQKSSEYGLAMAEARQAAKDALTGSSLMDLKVDPLEFCASQGITVVHEDETSEPLPKGVAGATQFNGSTFRVVLGRAANYGFLNFTLAHELGHICIESHQSLFTGNQAHFSGDGFSGSKNLHERQADHFAASFLMPEAPCRRLLDGIPDDEAGLQSIVKLQKACNVSLTAAAIRYAELTSHIAAIVVSTDGKVDYCIRSKELIEIVGWNRSIEKGSSLPKYTASQKLTQNAPAITAAVTEEGETRWDTWFGTCRDEVFEEAKGLGKYGKVLTVLTANG